MKGLIVKSNFAEGENTLKVALPDGTVHVHIIITRYEGVHWNVSGMKMPELISLGWKSGYLKLGDEIEVEFADIAESAHHVHQQTYSEFKERIAAASSNEEEDEEMWQRKLERYHRLKAILEKENLIS